MENIKEIVTIESSERVDNEFVQFIKTLMHGIIMPVILAIVLRHTTDLSGSMSLLYGALYLVIPAGIYHEKIRPEPTGFFILSAIYLYMTCLVYAMEGGPYHVL